MRRRSDRKPSRWSDPRKAASPSEPSLTPFRETALLAALMYMQRDAVAFYSVAAGRLGNAADNAVAALRRLHETAVRQLWERLQDMPRPNLAEEADSDMREYFSPLAQKLPYGLTRALADDILAAEENGLHTVEEALGDPLSDDMRDFLTGHLLQLGEVYERAQDLKDIANKPETPPV